jgi:hypothetical protein
VPYYKHLNFLTPFKLKKNMMKNSIFRVFSVALIVQSCLIVKSAKIVFFYPLSPGSEISAVQPLVKALLEGGHSVTFVTSNFDPYQHPNYTQVLPLNTTTVKDYVGNYGAQIVQIVKTISLLL